MATFNQSYREAVDCVKFESDRNATKGGGGGAAVSFRALEFKSADPEYKSCSDHPQDLKQTLV